MNSSLPFRKTLLISAISLATFQAHAAGFQLSAQSATGLGRAFAGDSAIGDNASIVARNPAGMALFEKSAISTGVEIISTNIEVKDGTYTNNLTASTSTANTDNAGAVSVVPNLYYIQPVNNKFAWGLNLYSNFGMKTDFDSDYQGYEYGGKTSVKGANVGLVASYRVNRALSLGVGLDAVYAEGTFSRPANPVVAGAFGVDNLLDVKADGWALGYNVGALFELDDNNRFGFDYHYSPELESDGDVYKFNPADPTATAQSDTVIMPLPDMAEFSGFHRLSADYAIHYSVQFIRWSEFDKLEAKKAGLIKDYQWQNAFHYAIGGTYYMNNAWELRAGYLYDTSAQDELHSISVPDSDRQWISAGFTYKPDTDTSIDFGATYLLGKNVEASESNALSSITGTTHADALLAAVQYSRSF